VSASAAVEPGVDGGRMTLGEHLSELRHRIVVSLLAVTAGGVVVFIFYPRILEFLAKYYQRATGNPKQRFVNFGPLEGISNRLNVTAYGGLMLALPVVLFQLWRFITPGLKEKEKKYAIPFVISSMVLFFFGVFVAFLTLEPALKFLVDIAGRNVEQLYSPNSFVRLVTLMTVAFGFAFQFPVILVFLQLANVLTWRKLLKGWRYAIVLIFVIAAVITPSQDPYSLFAMAIPMVVFYFASVGIGRVLRK
jgi:sec-independent protein translocase protein TatC